MKKQLILITACLLSTHAAFGFGRIKWGSITKPIKQASEQVTSQTKWTALQLAIQTRNNAQLATAIKNLGHELAQNKAQYDLALKTARNLNNQYAVQKLQEAYNQYKR